MVSKRAGSVHHVPILRESRGYPRQSLCPKCTPPEWAAARPAVVSDKRACDPGTCGYSDACFNVHTQEFSPSTTSLSPAQSPQFQSNVAQWPILIDLERHCPHQIYYSAAWELFFSTSYCRSLTVSYYSSVPVKAVNDQGKLGKHFIRLMVSEG